LKSLFIRFANALAIAYLLNFLALASGIIQLPILVLSKAASAAAYPNVKNTASVSDAPAAFASL
jgi:hypothetical protein